ncbi:TRAP transporter large permease subunit [Acuticoccus sediminis]|uniref:TRAP transporter large permease subunit n=1 Tax=Acuticoccus sediminis TaxID=2184697 RepID=UPI001CFC5470|nr:TRAP transporter large permease subunit [Acuticoccus sediminis]
MALTGPVVVALIAAIRLAGIPLSAGLAVTGAAILFAYEGGVSPVVDAAVATFGQPQLIAIPLFLFMGKVMTRVGIVDDLFDVARTLCGHVRGGLGVATVLSSILFAVVSGSSLATVVSVGARAIPAMAAAGYARRHVAGLVAAGGALAVLTPPSVPLMLYAVAAHVSMGALFLAALVPGIVLGLLFAISAILDVGHPGHERAPFAGWHSIGAALARSFAVLLLPPLILGGLYFGLVTNVEAAATGAVYALAVALLAPRRVSVADVGEAGLDALKTTIPVAALILGAGIFAAAVAAIGLPAHLAAITQGWGAPAVVLAALAVAFLAAMVVDNAVVVLVITPLVLPALTGLGVDLLWYGVLLTLTLGLATITPPFGLTLFVVRGIANLPHREVGRGAWPFVILLLAAIALVLLVPHLATMVPQSSGLPVEAVPVSIPAGAL